MKKILFYLFVCTIAVIGYSCSDGDNYAAPSETLTGSVIDITTGKPIQTEVGSGGVRIRLDELSWSANPDPYYFYSKQDGTFNNTKIFEGNYRISVEGAFVPIVQYDNSGNVTVDNRQTTVIKGVKTVNFSVEPFLKVEWVGDPVLNADKTVSVKVKVSRGTNNASFQSDFSDIFLFINSTSYVGNNNYDQRYSTQVSYNGSDGNSALGQTLTLTTKAALPGQQTWYVRVGARVNYGLKYYNYNEPKSIVLP